MRTLWAVLRDWFAIAWHRHEHANLLHERRACELHLMQLDAAIREHDRALTAKRVIA